MWTTKLNQFCLIPFAEWKGRLKKKSASGITDTMCVNQLTKITRPVPWKKS